MKNGCLILGKNLRFTKVFVFHIAMDLSKCFVVVVGWLLAWLGFFIKEGEGKRM